MTRKRSEDGDGKKKRDFLAGYKTYDTSTGYGSRDQWRAAFETMTEGQAREILGRRSPHAVLGLSVEDARDLAEVKKAYRREAMKYHPDRNPGDREAETKFREAKAAYVALGGKD